MEVMGKVASTLFIIGINAVIVGLARDKGGMILCGWAACSAGALLFVWGCL